MYWMLSSGSRPNSTRASQKNQKSNMIVCPHAGEPMHRIVTSTKTVFLCLECLAEMESTLSRPETIRLMLKSCMKTEEVQKMRAERENIRIQRDLADTMAAAHAVAGFPRLLALPAPGVV